MKLTIDKNGSEIGFILEECIQKIMKSRGFDHPLDAIQYMIEHLVAVAAAIGIPSVAIIESCMSALAAGTHPDVREQTEQLFEEFEHKRTNTKAH
jgi:hypothetical protein